MSMRIFIKTLTAALLLISAGLLWAGEPEGSGSGAPVEIDKMPAMVASSDGQGALPEYPASALEDSLEGTVFVSLTVRADGTPSDIKISKGVREDLDQSALKFIRQAKFIAGESKGKPVDVTVMVPVKFKLEKK